MAWDEELAEQSAREAENELRLMLGGMTKEQREAVVKVSGWWEKWFNNHNDNGRFVHGAGHKKLHNILNSAVR